MAFGQTARGAAEGKRGVSEGGDFGGGKYRGGLLAIKCKRLRPLLTGRSRFSRGKAMLSLLGATAWLLGVGAFSAELEQAPRRVSGCLHELIQVVRGCAGSQDL